MRSSTTEAGRRLTVAIVLLGLLTPACFLRSVTGRVGDLGEVIEATFTGNALVHTCDEFPGGMRCTYNLGGGDFTSTAELIGEFGLLGVLIDPLILQVPNDIGTVRGVFNYQGQDEPLEVTVTNAFDADAATRVQAEAGKQFVIVDFPESARQAIAAADEPGLDIDMNLSIDLPRLEALQVKPIYTVRIDRGGRTFYPPMLPCTTDLSAVPIIEIPVSDGPVSLLSDLQAVSDLAQPCDGQTYDFGDEATDPRVERIFGQDRIETAIEVSRATYPQHAFAAGVVLARADDFPDAMAGAPLAWALAAPILLTGSDALDPRVRAEIQRAIPPEFDVYVLGGPAAIGAAVVAEVEAMGHQVFRIGGSNRFETAVAVTDFVQATPEVVYVADGGTFPAALLSGAAGAAGRGNVLLTSGSDMPPATRAWLDANPDVPRVAVGSPAVEADPGATPITGSTAEISVALADRVWGAAPDQVYLASDQVFADGLSAGPLSGSRGGFSLYTGGPLLLTDPQSLAEPIRAWLADNGPTIERAAIIGGPVAVNEDVRAAAATALG